MPRNGMKLTEEIKGKKKKKSETRLPVSMLTLTVVTVVKFILTKDIRLCLIVKEKTHLGN